ncbi:hypothetical protein BgiBS90_002037 [Biomphalaria glabrata]|nr:hypothetical protein BgiBS90_002037 [Biomphalaria glabrata]
MTRSYAMLSPAQSKRHVDMFSALAAAEAKNFAICSGASSKPTITSLSPSLVLIFLSSSFPGFCKPDV